MDNDLEAVTGLESVFSGHDLCGLESINPTQNESCLSSIFFILSPPLRLMVTKNDVKGGDEGERGADRGDPIRNRPPLDGHTREIHARSKLCVAASDEFIISQPRARTSEGRSLPCQCPHVPGGRLRGGQLCDSGQRGHDSSTKRESNRQPDCGAVGALARILLPLPLDPPHRIRAGSLPASPRQPAPGWASHAAAGGAASPDSRPVVNSAHASASRENRSCPVGGTMLSGKPSVLGHPFSLVGALIIVQQHRPACFPRAGATAEAVLAERRESA